MPRNLHKLLLVFIHGFKGDEQTFKDFPEWLAVTMNNQPNLITEPIVFKQYETRGQLGQAVDNFCAWLDDEVKSHEEAKIPIDGKNVSVPVWVCLLGHSMGGLVAADAILKYRELGAKKSPKIIGLLAYDTPYYGLAFEMGGFGALKWTAAALAVGAVGAMTYKHKDKLGVGMDWVSDHLKFVGVLVKRDELKKRLDTLIQDPKLIFHCFYTLIPAKNYGDRTKTFISLPPEHMRQYFSPYECEVSDEIEAHVSMFDPKTNHNYYILAQNTTSQLLKMLENFE
ncbi:3438_t:CDS:2 [Ambispora leptoticha]|uniref:3438_t:CDS:1 n=1 Tax=Ambispora leptoticha TaxID=144679 RepID=A0A9N8YT11_9GLOM|nr:3438_t:CDS:2 [Ambispora leptoticha]